MRMYLGTPSRALPPALELILNRLGVLAPLCGADFFLQTSTGGLRCAATPGLLSGNPPGWRQVGCGAAPQFSRIFCCMKILAGHEQSERYERPQAIVFPQVSG